MLAQVTTALGLASHTPNSPVALPVFMHIQFSTTVTFASTIRRCCLEHVSHALSSQYL
jgi:hypothetical protein